MWCVRLVGWFVLFGGLLLVPTGAGAERAPMQVHAVLAGVSSLPTRTAPGGQEVPYVPAFRGLVLLDDDDTPIPDTGTTAPLDVPVELGTLPNVRHDLDRWEAYTTRRTAPAHVHVLTSDHVGPPVPATHGTTHRNHPTLASWQAAIDQTAARLERTGGHNDVVFLAFMGHGTPNGLVFPDGILSPQAIETAAAKLRAAGAELVVIVADVCYGAVVTADPALEGRVRPKWMRLFSRRLVQPSGIAVFRSVTQVPDGAVPGSGTLTHVVLSGLMGAADADSNGQIQFNELDEFVSAATRHDGNVVTRSTPPGERRDIVLVDLSSTDRGEVELRLSRRMHGRFLVADGNRVIAEAPVRSVPLDGVPYLRLRVPVESDDQRYDLWFIGVDRLGRPTEVRWLEQHDVILGERSWSHFEGPLAPEHPIGDYLMDTQSYDGLFSTDAARLTDVAVGHRLMVTTTTGLQVQPAVDRVTAAEATADPLLARIAEVEPQTWNVVPVELTARAHGPFGLLVEGRLGMGVVPETRVNGQSARVWQSRTVVGAGVAMHLWDPAVIGWASGGMGSLGLMVRPTGQATGGDALPANSDRFGTTSYGSLGVRAVVRGLPPLVVEGTRFSDRYQLCGAAACSPSDTRSATAWRVAVGVDLMQGR